MEEVSRKKVNSRKEISDIEPVFKPGVFLFAILFSIFNGAHDSCDKDSQDGAQQTNIKGEGGGVDHLVAGHGHAELDGGRTIRWKFRSFQIAFRVMF